MINKEDFTLLYMTPKFVGTSSVLHTTYISHIGNARNNILFC